MANIPEKKRLGRPRKWPKGSSRSATQAQILDAIEETEDDRLILAEAELNDLKAHRASELAKLDVKIAACDQRTAEGSEQAEAAEAARKRLSYRLTLEVNNARERRAKVLAKIKHEQFTKRVVGGEELSPLDLETLGGFWQNATPALLVLFREAARSLQRIPYEEEVRDIGVQWSRAIQVATGEAEKRREHIDQIPGSPRFPQKLGVKVAKARVEGFIIKHSRLPDAGEIVGLFPEPLSAEQAAFEESELRKNPDGTISLQRVAGAEARAKRVERFL